MKGSFVISLDFELLWGVRDQADKKSYGENILGAREAIPRILDLFASNDVRATWATVGFLFCESKEHLLASIPEDVPHYERSELSSYQYINEVGDDEASDPYYFAPSLIDKIKLTPGQEVGTHTLSHYYCLEKGQDLRSFEADLRSAQNLAKNRGIEIKSIVFPRNQFSEDHLKACARLGILAYRGNPLGWTYRSTAGSEQTLLRRACRLSDSFIGVLGPHLFDCSKKDTLANVPASHFLRPCAGQLSRLYSLHLATIKRSMTEAAQSGLGYHLWWHPHNFGRNPEANMRGLQQIVDHYRTLRDKFGMQSACMADFV